MLTPTESAGGEWNVVLQPEVLLPSRDAHAAITFTPERELKHRASPIHQSEVAANASSPHRVLPNIRSRSAFLSST